jgi:hypothetical protein
MAVIGISINEISQASTAVATDRISKCTLLCTPSGAAASLLNQLIGVSSATDFAVKYPTAPEVVLQSVKMFFLNYADGQLNIFACSDSTLTGNTQTDLKGHILKGVGLLTLRTDLDLSFCICPEIGGFTAQADRTAIFSAIETLCQKFDWLFFFNAAVDTDTKAKALSERALYSSPLGHSSFYYGRIVDNDSKIVPVSVAAAAIALKRDRSEPYAPPAGAKYPLQGVKDLVNYVDNAVDYKDLNAQQINVLQRIPKYGTCIWGAQTLSIDPRFSLINTRMSVSVATFRLESSLIPVLFNSSDPQGRTNRDVDRTIISLMTNLWQENALSGATPEESFKIVDIVVPATPTQGTGTTTPQGTTAQTTAQTTTIARNLRKIQKQVFGRFVEHIQMIEIGVFVVDSLPT